MSANTQREAAVKAIEALEEFLSWPDDDEPSDDTFTFSRQVTAEEFLVVPTTGEAGLETSNGRR